MAKDEIGNNKRKMRVVNRTTIKDKLVDLTEIQREGSLDIGCNDRHAFFTSDAVRIYTLWSCQKVYEALTFLLFI